MLEITAALLAFTLVPSVCSQSCPAGKAPTCPKTLTATNMYYPHPNDCNYYYQCGSGGQIFCQKCPDGLYFNPKVNVCDWPQNVKCTSGQSTMTTKQLGSTTRKPVILTTIPTTTWNSSCPNVPPSQPCPQGLGEGIHGFLPHPQRSDCYFDCFGNTPQLRECPGDLTFNPQAQYCE